MPLPNIIKQFRNRVQRILYPTSEKVLTLQVNLFYSELKSALVINVVIILIMSLFLGIVFNNPVYSYFAVALVLHSMATYVYISVRFESSKTIPFAYISWEHVMHFQSFIRNTLGAVFFCWTGLKQ